MKLTNSAEAYNVWSLTSTFTSRLSKFLLAHKRSLFFLFMALRGLQETCDPNLGCGPRLGAADLSE
jgi:hypothetical protein